MDSGCLPGHNQKAFDPDKHWVTYRRGVCVERVGTLMNESFNTVPAQAALRSSPRMVRPISKPIGSAEDMWALWYDASKEGIQYARYRLRGRVPRDENNCMKLLYPHLFNYYNYLFWWTMSVPSAFFEWSCLPGAQSVCSQGGARSPAR